MAQVFWNQVHNNPSRSSKVIDFGTNRKRIYDFLLDLNSNLGPILPRFRDIRAFERFFDTTHLFRPKFRGVRFPLGVGPRCWGFQRANTPGQLTVKLSSKYSNLCDHDTSTSRTDRRADGQLTVAIPRFA